MSGGASSDLSSLFKKPAGSWECPTCMIQNKADVNKCVACSMSKPSSMPQGGSTVTVGSFVSLISVGQGRN